MKLYKRIHKLAAVKIMEGSIGDVETFLKHEVDMGHDVSNYFMDELDDDVILKHLVEDIYGE